MMRLSLIVLLSCVHSWCINHRSAIVLVEAFAAVSSVTTTTATNTCHRFPDCRVPKSEISAPLSRLLNVRGGASTSATSSFEKANMSDALSAVATAVSTKLVSSLQSGSLGVVGLTAIAASVCIPATQYKNLYGISVGYGLSVAAMAITLLTSSAVVHPVRSAGHALAWAATFYGLRLAAFLFVRDVTNAKPLVSKGKEPDRIKRVPFALSLALFYAFMTTPLLYSLRGPVRLLSDGMFGTWQSSLAWIGTGLAWMGAVLEAVADAHKFVAKSGAQGTAFRGPTGGVYRVTRHPNYTGEVLFWSGLYLAGLPSFQRSIVAWVCSSLGWYGIVSIMRGATKSLEQRQAEKYGGQPKYETWKKDVSGPLLPFLPGY
jgi:steroid 5-alpha reductase family enzyme